MTTSEKIHKLEVEIKNLTTILKDTVIFVEWCSWDDRPEVSIKAKKKLAQIKEALTK